MVRLLISYTTFFSVLCRNEGPYDELDSFGTEEPLLPAMKGNGEAIHTSLDDIVLGVGGPHQWLYSFDKSDQNQPHVGHSIRRRLTRKSDCDFCKGCAFGAFIPFPAPCVIIAAKCGTPLPDFCGRCCD